MAPGARKNLLKLGGILTMTRSFFLSICGFWGDFWPLVDFQGDMRRQHFWEPANDGRRPARPASEKKHRRLQDGVLWHKNPWTLASPELGNRSTYHSCHWMLNMFLGFLRTLSNMSFWCHFFSWSSIPSCSLVWSSNFSTCRCTSSCREHAVDQKTRSD